MQESAMLPSIRKRIIDEETNEMFGMLRQERICAKFPVPHHSQLRITQVFGVLLLLGLRGGRGGLWEGRVGGGRDIGAAVVVLTRPRPPSRKTTLFPQNLHRMFGMDCDGPEIVYVYPRTK